MPTVQEALQLGLAHQRSGDLAAAEHVYHRILAVAPAHPDVLHLLGLIASQQGRAEEAIARIGAAIAEDGSAALYHHNLANVYLAQQRVGEAEACYRRALAVQPDYLSSQRQLAGLLHASGRTEESAAWWRRVLERSPDDADALNNLGVILADAGDLAAAREHYQQALRSRPNFPAAHNNLGNTFVAEDDFAAAEAEFLAALRMDPRFPAAHHNMGLLRAHQGRWVEAEAAYRRAIELAPLDASAHADLGLVLLLQGDFRQGWPEYEWRRQIPCAARRKFTEPCWDGSPLAGRTILLHAEEGLGDTLQFVRLASLVRGHAGRLILECPSALCELISTAPGIDQVVAAGQTLPPFDVQAPLLAVPAILGLTPETIPCRVPYLAANAPRVEHWRRRLGAEPGFKVGIVWQGRPTFRFDAWRSIPLERFRPLAAVPGARLYSLQKGPGSEQLAATGRTFAVTDLGRELDNGGSAFVDTAAVLKNLDLVITSDTAMAHLAGALGVPTWVALPLAPDWRWLLGRDDSPWYPTLRLFRQTQRRGWPDVFARLAAALADAIAKRQQPAHGHGAPLRVS
jgi:tetratricopeptide (TPR) repeat protein